jgi:hypothetical protein
VALMPPAADAATVAKVVEGLEAGAEIDDHFAHALRFGSVHELEYRIGQVELSAEALRGLPKELGLKVCGRPGATG